MRINGLIKTVEITQQALYLLVKNMRNAHDLSIENPEFNKSIRILLEPYCGSSVYARNTKPRRQTCPTLPTALTSGSDYFHKKSIYWLICTP